VIGALVTDDPHWDTSPGRKAWGDRITKWGFQPKEHPYNPARWTEIHPPDHVHVLPPQERDETVRCVAMVARADLSFSETRKLDLKIKPPGDRPDPRAYVDYIEAIGGETTTGRIVRKNISRNSDHIHVIVWIKSDPLLAGGEADFKAIYRVFWRVYVPPPVCESAQTTIESARSQISELEDQLRDPNVVLTPQERKAIQDQIKLFRDIIRIAEKELRDNNCPP